MAADRDGLLERIRNETLDVYRASPVRLREDASQEAEIAHDYQGRLVYELLQNADDAMAGDEGRTDRVSFWVTDTDLWVANTGRPLTEADIRGLCGIGAGTKDVRSGPRRASIGHKGMGFKSVLELTSTPAVYSTTWCLEMDATRARESLTEVLTSSGQPAPARYPIMRFPWPVETCPEWEEARKRGYQTLFRFRFDTRVNAERRARLAEDLINLPVTTILFLKHLEALEIHVDIAGRSEDIVWALERKHHQAGEWRPCTGLDRTGPYQVWISSDRDDTWCFLLAHDDQLRIGTHRGGLNEYAWSGVDLAEVTVAALLLGHDTDILPPEWRRFHVFLPTAERCPYPLLINGAFASDLSRQEIRVSPAGDDYNTWLIGEAARVFRDGLLPALRNENQAPTQILGLLDRSAAVAADTSAALHRAMTSALADEPLVPAGETLITLAQTVVPPIVGGRLGDDIRRLLPDEVTIDGRRLPSVGFCGQALARIAVDHGATALPAAAVAHLLADAEPGRSKPYKHPSERFSIDPVLNVLERLWRAVDPEGRREVEAAARTAAVFPIRIKDDGSAVRVPTADAAAFYPTRSLKSEVPLRGIRFLAHEICWGRLTPQERTDALRAQMPAWQALFGLREFKFPEVMRTSVLPALELDPDERTEQLHLALGSKDVLAAICQLSGPTPNPTSPLTHERLGPNRALFNLCRLPVPCRINGSGPVEWVPAYRSYLGPGWIGGASVTHILDSLKAAGMPMNDVELAVLVQPAELQGLLDRYQGLDDGAPPTAEAEDEVSLDEDEESPLDADEHNRWLRFLTWIGVNRMLRPVHFHDAEDRGSGWLSTKGLTQPVGWAFRDLRDLWTAFQARIAERVSELDPQRHNAWYFYRLHDLEHLLWLLTAAEGDGTGSVARALFRHLALNWPQLAPFMQAEVALVPLDKSPGLRNPRRAHDDERHPVGDDLWVTRLKDRRFCPTTQGPLQPARSWLPSAEADRRFGRNRSGRDAGDLLPLLDTGLAGDEIPRALTHLLGIRSTLTPTTFEITDALALCQRLAQIYLARVEAGTLTDADLRQVIRPTYREMFELLSGASAEAANDPPLNHAPLLVTSGPGRYQFRSGDEVLMVDRAGQREILGIGPDVWTFVLEGEQAARRPLQALFGARILGEALEWQPELGEPALDDAGIAAFRAGLGEVAPYLLARLRIIRTDERLAEQDARRLRWFISHVEPVTDLTVTAALGGAAVAVQTERRAFVRPGAVNPYAVIRWGEHPWPPDPEEQETLAIAITELLQVSYLESFLALLGTNDDGRLRLLGMVGASTELDAARRALKGEMQDPPDEGPAPATAIEPTPAPAGQAPELVPTPPWKQPAPHPSIPLLSLSQLTLDGTPVLVRGTADQQRKPPRPDMSPDGKPRRNGYASSGTDLTALNQLGMDITMAYEVIRLHRKVFSARIFDPEEPVSDETLIYDVSTPAAIMAASTASPQFKAVLTHLTSCDVAPDFPGFDVMTLAPGNSIWPERMIELKSSGVNARVQEMTWNEWKTAQHSQVRPYFYLYLVGNLRADLPSAPFIRTVHDPFANLWNTTTTTERTVRRTVQLNTQEFDAAEELTLGVVPR